MVFSCNTQIWELGNTGKNVAADLGMGFHFIVFLIRQFAHFSDDVEVTSDKTQIERADKLVLPGVGEFGACMGNFIASGLMDTVLDRIKAGVPLLGICVGLQILFEGSEESPEAEGLGIFKGMVKRIVAPGLKIPHMGWNSVEFSQPSLPLFDNLPENPYVYFVHSYHAVPKDKSIVAALILFDALIQSIVVEIRPQRIDDDELRIRQLI